MAVAEKESVTASHDSAEAAGCAEAVDHLKMFLGRQANLWCSEFCNNSQSLVVLLCADIQSTLALYLNPLEALQHAPTLHKLDHALIPCLLCQCVAKQWSLE